jgi:hypothetical protein
MARLPGAGSSIDVGALVPMIGSSATQKIMHPLHAGAAALLSPAPRLTTPPKRKKKREKGKKRKKKSRPS